MLEAILPVLLAFVSLGAFELGTRVRDRVHVVMPWKDPLTLLFALIVLSPAIAYAAGHQFMELNVWYAAFAIAFLSCYSLAYIRGDLGLVYVNVHTIFSERFPAGAQEIKPVVWYEDRDGRMCLQEQSFKEILKTVFLGIRSPLRLDVRNIQRARYLSVQKVLFPKVEMEAVDVVEEKIEETIVNRWIFKFKVRSYSYTPAPPCIDTTQRWLATEYNYDYMVKENTRMTAEVLEAKITSRSQFIGRNGDLFAEMIGDRTPGAEIIARVAERFEPQNGIEAVGTVRRTVPAPPKHRKKEAEE